MSLHLLVCGEHEWRVGISSLCLWSKVTEIKEVALCKRVPAVVCMIPGLDLHSLSTPRGLISCKGIVLKLQLAIFFQSTMIFD